MSSLRVIAFYLPQFHPIPENDKWWGKGFTEWTNVAKAKPLFRGHHQPHLPADLGFYDLRYEETRIAQAELAEHYGINGFCYYHYWFNNGTMLLEKPFNEVLSSGKPDFPFCLCWANENWTRRWDGKEKEILMEQNYDTYDPENHMRWLLKAFSDRRYISINGKPLFLIYKIDSIPDLVNKIKIWRSIARENGFPELYLCSVKSVHNKLSDSEILSLGFDALVEFNPPNYFSLPKRKYLTYPSIIFNALVNKIISAFLVEGKFKKLPVASVHSYEEMVNKILEKPKSSDKTFYCVTPGWDNSPRTKFSVVIQNEDSELYKKWLCLTLEKTKDNPPDEQIVFINAWNEWAEGCYLEPDLKNGRKFLEATLEAVNKVKDGS